MKTGKEKLISFLMGRAQGQTVSRIDRAASVVVGPPAYQKMLRIKEWCEGMRENVNTSSIDEVLTLYGKDSLLPKVRKILEFELIKQHGKSHRDLASDLGISPGAVSKMINDTDRGVTITNTLKMFDIFKTEVLSPDEEKKVDSKKKFEFNPEITKMEIRIAELEEENQMLKVMLSEKELALRRLRLSKKI
jgi:predicted transcriptional regulator